MRFGRFSIRCKKGEERLIVGKVKRFFVVMILSLLALLPKVWAEGPDDQYVTIYNLIQLGDMYNEKGQVASARANYEDALSVLKKFQAANPDWNVKVVKYRLKAEYDADVRLEQVRAVEAPGVTHLKYRVVAGIPS